MTVGTGRAGGGSPDSQRYGIRDTGRMTANECHAEHEGIQWRATLMGTGFDLVSFAEAMTQGVYFYCVLQNR